MSKRLGLILFFCLAGLFLIVNRAAYRGWFQDDEIDNLSWARYSHPADYVKGVLSPRFERDNFRPVGHFLFYAGALGFGLDFPKYVAAIHGIHLLNVWLLWLLVRRLGTPPLASCAACAFFAFHMALFDAFWKPMYVFDLLCATCCLACLLFWMGGRWILSLVSFWLAYKAKELAVMLPLVLACYELWLGKRRWKLLAPFFLVSLSFGMQGLVLNPNRDNEYTFRFTAAALAKTVRFYAGRVFLIPWAGLLLPGALLVSKKRSVRFGLAAMGLFLLPMLFLPGRVFGAYCYVPFIGLAAALAGVAEAVRPAYLAAFFALWIPLDLNALRAERNVTLARDAAIHRWFDGLGVYAATQPNVDAFVFDGAPAGFARWGVEGGVKYLFDRFDAKVYAKSDPQAASALASGRTALLTWKAAEGRLEIQTVK